MASGSVGIGSVFGIRISLHWTFVILLLLPLFLFLFTLESIYILGFLGIVLLFTCVFLHELAHSVTAIRNKVKVKEIILLPIGGLSMIDSVRIRPDIEFNLSIAGPVMSLFLGGIFGILAVISPMGIITFAMQLMFILNMFLGLFNMLPAFPMDGGRVMMSYMREKRGEFDATMLTARISKYIIALIVVGTLAYIIEINANFIVKEVDFLITLFIAFWLYGGTQAERERAILRRDTKGLTVISAAAKDFVLVDPGASIEELYRLFKSSKEHIIITKGGDGYALVDIFRRRAAVADYAQGLTVNVPNLPANTNVIDAIVQLGETGIGILVRGGKPIGIITSQRLQALITLHTMSKAKKGRHSAHGTGL